MFSVTFCKIEIIILTKRFSLFEKSSRYLVVLCRGYPGCRDPHSLRNITENDQRSSARMAQLFYIWAVIVFAKCDMLPSMLRKFISLLFPWTKFKRLLIHIGNNVMPVSRNYQEIYYVKWIYFQKWFDYKLQWDPEEYGGVEMLYVPSEHIWLPDIVLFNK